MDNRKRDTLTYLKHQDICRAYDEAVKNARASLQPLQRIDFNKVRELVATQFRCSTKHVSRVVNNQYKRRRA